MIVLEFLSNHGGSILIAAALAAVVVLIFLKLHRDRKKGKGSCGCGCSSCPSAGLCHKGKLDDIP
ncbi:MAG: FeoB-associated Cys-rich membrane protein [Oscillospiraceae bacterium]|nr:FeoB-associated Cys-rich membrane protein [Oscillospiraceae bacterium]